MKEKELKTIYRFNSQENAYNIDINLDNYRDVYSDWDYAPLTNRDLDEDLLKYIMSCSYEISKKHKLIVNFYLHKNIYDPKRESRSIEGINNYFAYKIREIKTERFILARSTFLFLLIGIMLLILGIFLEGIIEKEFFRRLTSEGLFIGAWVAMWEMFSIWFFKINELTLKLKHYKRLQVSTISYNYKE